MTQPHTMLLAKPREVDASDNEAMDEPDSNEPGTGDEPGDDKPKAPFKTLPVKKTGKVAATKPKAATTKQLPRKRPAAASSMKA